MTYIPDCRTDDVYNQDKLNKMNKEFVKGYDWCIEEVVDNFFNNMDIWFAEDSHLMHMLSEKVPEDLRESYEMEWTFVDKEPEQRTVETYADLIRARILDWVEDERDELITSMIDHQDEE